MLLSVYKCFVLESEFSGSSSRETLIDDVYIESKKYIGNWLIVGWKVCDEYI